MVRVTRKKKKKARRLYGLVFLGFLSAAAGVGLYKLSPSLLDIGRNFRHAADKILEQSADTLSAEPVLRGTVFDRNLKELAVSYKLYSLYVRPAEITDIQHVVQIVADVTGLEESQLHAKLNEIKNIVNIADNLEQAQVDLIKHARLPGLYVKPVEERFYPEHETAASLVGFTGKGMGLSGVEGAFDILLQEGEFRTNSVADIDFSEEHVLGSAKVDIILSVDLEQQKQVEQQLKNFLDRSNASRGVALLMDPRSGSVVSWTSQPSYNPNYYWRARESNNNSLFEENLDPELLQNLRTRVAASIKQGDSGDFLLPVTVAKKDYGLKKSEVEQYWLMKEQYIERNCTLPSCGVSKTVVNGENVDASSGISPVEWAVAVSGLVNGGWKVSPYVLDAVYDHGQERIHKRSDRNGKRERLVSPSVGIKVRRDLISSSMSNKKNMILLTDAVKRIRKNAGKSEYIIQEALVAAIPAKSPELLFLMITQQDDLYPFPQKKKSRKISIRDFGKDLLATLYDNEQKGKNSQQYVASAIPRGPDKSNYNQFLISSRIDFQEQSTSGFGRVAVMPQLVGLSLRKGLQRINEYDVQVKVQGSGQIVSQVPGPGEPLNGIGECVLTLGSEI